MGQAQVDDALGAVAHDLIDRELLAHHQWPIDPGRPASPGNMVRFVPGDDLVGKPADIESFRREQPLNCEDCTRGGTFTFPLGNYMSAALVNYVRRNTWLRNVKVHKRDAVCGQRLDVEWLA